MEQLPSAFCSLHFGFTNARRKIRKISLELSQGRNWQKHPLQSLSSPMARRLLQQRLKRTPSASRKPTRISHLPTCPLPLLPHLTTRARRHPRLLSSIHIYSQTVHNNPCGPHQQSHLQVLLRPPTIPVAHPQVKEGSMAIILNLCPRNSSSNINKFNNSNTSSSPLVSLLCGHAPNRHRRPLLRTCNTRRYHLQVNLLPRS